MKRLLSFFFVLVFFSLSLFLFATQSFSDELDDLNKKINELTSALNMSINATKPLESELNRLKTEITGIKNQVSFLEQDIAEKKKNIDKGYDDLAETKKILDKTIVNHYITSYYDNLFSYLLSGSSATDLIQNLVYQKAQADQNKAIITNIVLSVTDLETKKENLEQEQIRLTAIKANLDEQSAKLDKVVQGAKAYQSSVSTEIAQLSAKQQQLVSQRLGNLNIPRSAGTSTRGCADDRNVDPGFSPRVAFFSYGAPHRNGLNQYGAFARAKDGQNEQKILEEYYPGKTLKTDYDQGVQISTTTGWTGSIEDYVKRIYEVPNDWGDQGGMAALKAQAVAARSYALNVTSNGSKQICTTEQCQVFKSDPKGGNWEQAVEATKGWVLMDGGSPAFTQYASTHGGYIQNLGKFDGRIGAPANFSELNERAYDKESPWFYCDWGSRGQGNTAWLRPSEIADIINVILLARADSSTKDHFYQTDKPHPYGGDLWNEDRVKSELRSRNITPYNAVSDISVSADFGGGKTSSVNVSGDGGNQSFSGSEFKDWFNLRAPANIQIVGPLYNVERK